MAATSLKSRQILGDISSSSNTVSTVPKFNDEMTVEEFLELQCELIIQDFRNHTALQIKNLRQQYDDGAKSLKQLLDNSLSEAKPLCIILKCTGGSHIGQRFRLEATGVESEDMFKIGRSTGRHFKEKGVSVYKDKEISTTHAKIEVKNGQPFFVDLNSTNGTQINDDDLEPFVPYRLKNGDKITMGSTELQVQITDTENLENLTSTSV